MKKLILLFLLLIGMGAAAYFLQPKENGPKTSITAGDRNFSFPADNMGKITIQKKGNEMQSFERKGDNWFINNTYKVGKYAIPLLTQTFSKIAIQNLPSKKEAALMLKDIERKGIQVKIYDRGGTEVRSYKIGLESIDGTGTSFLMDGSTQPYNMYLRGHEGEIRSRILHKIDEWRDTGLFTFKAEEIQEIGIKYHKNEKSSFKLTKNGSTYDVKPLSQFMQASTKAIDKNRVNAYLGEFEAIYAESFDNDNIRRDSISALIPWATVAVKDKNGQVNEMEFFPFRDLILRGVNTVDAEEAKKIERYFVNRKDNKSFYVAQNRILKTIFVGYDYFLKD